MHKCAAIIAIGGEPVWRKAEACVNSVIDHFPFMPIYIFTDSEDRVWDSCPSVVKSTQVALFDGPARPIQSKMMTRLLTNYSRLLKLGLLKFLCEYGFKAVLYLDADTRLREDAQAGFEMLADGWDLVIAPSANQEDDLFWHIGDDERLATLSEIGYPPLQLQAGVMFVAVNPHTRIFFECWNSEWERFGNQDQAAMCRVLANEPIKIWLLGRPWNGGAVIDHRFGSFQRNLDSDN